MQRGQCYFVFLKCKMFRRLVIPDSSSSEGEGVSPITVRAAVHNESTTTLTLDELSQETQRIEDARKITEEVERTAITRTFEEIVDIGEESETQIIGTHRDNATLHQGKTLSIEREELSISKELETFPEKSKPNSLKPGKMPLLSKKRYLILVMSLTLKENHQSETIIHWLNQKLVQQIGKNFS